MVRPNRSGTAESPKAQGQSTKTVAKLPKLNERRAPGALVRLRAGMVGLLPPSRSYPSGFSTGTLDSETDAQMLLAALARQERAQEETPTTGYPRPGAQDRFQRSGSLAGGQVSHAPGKRQIQGDQTACRRQPTLLGSRHARLSRSWRAGERHCDLVLDRATRQLREAHQRAAIRTCR